MIETDLKSGGSAGVKVMIMPVCSAIQSWVVLYKERSGSGSSLTSTEAEYYTRMTTTTPDKTGASLIVDSAESTPQIIAISPDGQSGILTHIQTPRVITEGLVVVTVEIDGVTTEFSRVVGSSGYYGSDSMYIGNYARSTIQGFPTISFWGGVGLIADTPENNVVLGCPIGMVFKDSMKVSIQADTGVLDVGSLSNQACAVWLTNIPQGIE